MPAREFNCKVIAKKWLTPTVVELRFEPHRKFGFAPGQFVSVVVPPPAGAPKPLRRAYSLAVPPEDGWGLCVKVLSDGVGSRYIAALREGDTFKAFAPYGDFVYDGKSGRNACFVSTGTGLAPFLSMIRSKEYQANPPPMAMNLFGAATKNEIIHPGMFEALGMTEINAISDDPSYSGFKGRVTDYLKQLPAEWPWHSTDFYLCGNGFMVEDVTRHLRAVRGVEMERIHREVYFVAPDRLVGKPGAKPEPKIVVPPPPPTMKKVA